MSYPWPTIPLSDAGTWLSGKTPRRKNAAYWGGTIPWIGTKDLKGFNLDDASEHITDMAVNDGARVVEPGTILFVTRGMSLAKEFRVGITGARISFNQDVKAIVPRDELDGRFLAWFMVASEQLILSRVDTASHGTKRLALHRIEHLPVPFPPLDEQRRIAAILDKADAIRRKRREAIAMTEELLRSTFLEMFGDPVTNPKGWPVIALASTLSDPPRIGTTKPAHDGGEHLVVRVGEIGERRVALDRCGAVTLSPKDLERYRCFPGDYLLARAIGSASHLGKASILQSDKRTVVFDSHVMRLRFDPHAMLPEFFAAWMRSKGGRARFMRQAGRTAVQFNVNATQIARVQIPLPPIENQQDFLRIERFVREHQERLEHAQRGEDDLFHSLVQRAFAGEV